MSQLAAKSDNWDWTLLFLGVAGIGMSGLAALVMLGVAAVTWIESDFATALYPGWTALGFLVIGAVGLPAIYIGGRALLGYPHLPSLRPSSRWLAVLGLLPASLLLGYLAFETDALSGYFGPPAHFLAAGIPVLATVVVSIRNGPPVSVRRRWGHFLTGLWAVPPVAVVMEIFAALPVLILVVLSLSVSGGGQELLAQLADATAASEAELEALMEDLIGFPGVILGAVTYLSLIVPLVEEALKSMAVWPLLRRRITPGEAFLAGVLGGAGYALFESLFIPQPGGGWLATMIARSGTPLIHAFATGITCWGISQGVHMRRWLRMMLSYLAAVALHGLWNLGAVGLGLGGALIEGEIAVLPEGLGVAVSSLGGLTLLALSLFSLGGLLWVPRRLQGESESPA